MQFQILFFVTYLWFLACTFDAASMYIAIQNSLDTLGFFFFVVQLHLVSEKCLVVNGIEDDMDICIFSTLSLIFCKNEEETS